MYTAWGFRDLRSPSRVLRATKKAKQAPVAVLGRWEAVPWIKASAYGLFGLPVPWELPTGEIDADFRTSESGQMLFNRHVLLQENAAVKSMLSIIWKNKLIER